MAMTSNLPLDRQVIDLVQDFKTVLDAHEAHLKSFCTYGVQLEGWLKGEFLSFLEGEKTAGKIINFDREVRLVSDRLRKVDFTLQMTEDGRAESVWVELKHWLIGRQKGAIYNASFYFSDPTAAGISLEAKKLSKITERERYLFILATANPGAGSWQDGVTGFNRKFAPISLRSVVQQACYPDTYYFGILKVV